MRGRAGFSLIEALCALAVLGFGLLGVTQAITHALQSGKEAQYLTQATFLAESQIELLRAEGWIIEGEDTGDFGGAAPLFSWARRVSETTVDGLYDVEVEILMEPSGTTVYELRTRLFEMPLSTFAGESPGEERASRSAARRRQAAQRGRP